MTRLRPHFTQLFALALPLVGSQLAQQAITVTDTVMLGWYGIRELAAVTLGGTIFFSVFIVGSGFALAVMPMVAAARAAGDLRQVRRVTRMGLWIVAAYGLVSYPVFWFSAPLLVALGQAPDLAAAAQDYLRIAGAGLTLAVLVMVLKSHLAALGHAGVVLWATLAGAGLNGVLNWLLIFGRAGVPELGIEGAAIASLGTYGLILAVLAIYAARVPVLREYALFARIWRPDWPAFGQVFRLGWPIGLTVLAESGLFAAASLMVGWIGERELAAHGVALQIASVTFMVHVGLSSAATVRAGQAWGVRAVGSLRDG
ncbi:MAG: MATE family efflux transporter, partial [Pseudomonadota bacterium]